MSVALNVVSPHPALTSHPLPPERESRVAAIASGVLMAWMEQRASADGRARARINSLPDES